MNQIVVEAGTSIGNCYFYFQNKEALLSEIVMEIIDEIWDYPQGKYTNITSGIQRLAVIIYHGMTRMLYQEHIAEIMVTGNALPSVRRAIFADFRERVNQLIEYDPAIFRGGNQDLEIYVAYGAIFNLLELKRIGELTDDPKTVGLFIARWNLQAINYPQDEIEDAMAALNTIVDEPENDMEGSLKDS